MKHLKTGRRLLSLLLILFLLFSFAPAVCAAESKSEALLEAMTTEEKVCQLLMPSLRWWNDEEGERQELTQLNEAFAALLARHGFAGVVFFAQNTAETEATVRLIDAMQVANAKGEHRTQLLTAIDQEGGTVSNLGQGTAFSGNMALGAANDPECTKAAARVIGEELAALGFNMDFAPVLDVNSNPMNPVIGRRSFSDDARTVAAQSAAFMGALSENGTISTLKHFPGHGDTGTDSHTGLPRIEKTYEALKKEELVPFQACIDMGAEAVMTAHIQYPAIETQSYVSKDTGEDICLPATLSKTILTDILRIDMGFDGVIITDAMDMDAIDRNFDPMDAARLAINAGADILLMPVAPTELVDAEGIEKFEEYIDGVVKLVENGAIPMERIDESVARILALKETHGLLDDYDASALETRIANALTVVGSPEHHALEWEIAKKTITLLKNDNEVLPLTQAGQKIAVLTASDDEVLSMKYAVDRLSAEGRLPNGTEVAVASIQDKALDECLPLIDGMDHVIAISEVGSLAALSPASPTGAFSALLDALIAAVHEGGGTFTVLIAALPYSAARYSNADAVVIAWNSRGMSIDPRVTDGPVKQYGANLPAALYLMLSPDEAPSGSLPVALPNIDGDDLYSEEPLYPRGYGMTYDLSGQFPDLDMRLWYADGVRYVLTHRLMQGFDGEFCPDDAMTRAQAVATLWRIAGQPDAEAACFSDVPDESWYACAVRWAAETKLVNGYPDGTFRPDAPLDREQMVTLLWRCSGKPAGAVDLSGYADVGQISDWAKEAFAWAVGVGIVKGRGGGILDPAATVKRTEAAQIVMNYDTGNG